MVACEGVAFRHRKYFLCCSKFCIPRWIYQERAQIEECAYTRQIDEWAYAAYLRLCPDLPGNKKPDFEIGAV